MNLGPIIVRSRLERQGAGTRRRSSARDIKGPPRLYGEWLSATVPDLFALSPFFTPRPRRQKRRRLQRNNTNALKYATTKFHGNEWVKMIMYPHAAAMRTGRLLAPGVELVMELFCNRPDFFLLGPLASLTGVKRYVAFIRDNIKVPFHVCRLNLNASVYNDLKLKLSVKNKWAIYPMVRSEIRTFSFDGASTKWEEDNVFLNRIPLRVIVSLLDSRPFNGNWNYYPYAFQKWGVTSIPQIVFGEEYLYWTLELNGDNIRKDYLGYHRLLETSGSLLHHRPHIVKPTDWGHDRHRTLFAFNNVSNGDVDPPHHLNPKQKEKLRLEIKFNAIPGTNLIVMVWGEFEDVFQVDGNGAIFYKKCE